MVVGREMSEGACSIDCTQLNNEAMNDDAVIHNI
jgi:hypothetical protein